MRGNVNVTVDVVLGSSLDNTLGTLNVHICQGEVPEATVSTQGPGVECLWRRTW